MKYDHSPNTLRCYRCYWKSFCQWCQSVGQSSLPASADTVMHYVIWRLEENTRFSSVRCDLSAICFHHRQANLDNPVTTEVQELMRNAKRKLGQRARGKKALASQHLRELSKTLFEDESLLSIRDHAIILLGFATGWRGGELAQMQMDDISFDLQDRLVLVLGASKTDQDAKHGREVNLPAGKTDYTCPIRALRRWLAIRGDWQGPLFCAIGRHHGITTKPISTGVVRVRLRKYLGKLGLSTGQFGAHSLRVGMITSSVENGSDALAIAQRTGHRHLGSVLRYVRPAKALQFDPLAGVL